MNGIDEKVLKFLSKGKAWTTQAISDFTGLNINAVIDSVDRLLKSNYLKQHGTEQEMLNGVFVNVPLYKGIQVVDWKSNAGKSYAELQPTFTARNTRTKGR